MLVKSPFGRQFTDIADKLEQSFYCFGGDGGNDNGGSSAQNADMDKEMDAIDAEFSAMDAAYESGGSFTSEGVTTDSSDTSDSQQAVRESATEPGKTYNFNIDRSADYTVDEQGRRVYDTLDPQMQSLYDAEAQFDRMSTLLDSGVMTVLDESGNILSRDEQLDRDINVAETQFEALDAIYDNPRYADKLASLYQIDPETGEPVLDENGKPVPRGDLQIYMRDTGDILVRDPDMFDRIMGEDVGPGLANVIAGQLGGTFLATAAFDIFGAPVNAYSANILYQGGRAAASGSLFGSPLISATAWENPLTGENVTEQRLNIAGETVDRRFTTETEFRERQAAEQALKDQYDSGESVGDATALVESRTGTRKPSWRDYVNTDFSLEQAVFSSVLDSQNFASLPESIRDGVVLTKNLAEGQDPLTALIGVYGDDVAEQLNLEGLANEAIDASFSPETAQFIKENHDVLKLGADIVVRGKDPSAAIADRFGGKILDYLNADTPNLRAAGQAGLNFGVALDQGVPLDQALPRAVVDYFEQGGTVNLATEGGNFLRGVFPEINIDIPDINLPDLDINWKQTWDNINAKLPDADFRFANELIPDFGIDGLFDQGFTLEDFNWEAIDVSGLNLGDFTDQGYNLTDLESVGIDLPDLNIDIPEIEFELQLAQLQERIPGERVTTSGEVIQSLEPDLDFLEEDGLTFSRRLLQRTV